MTVKGRDIKAVEGAFQEKDEKLMRYFLDGFLRIYQTLQDSFTVAPVNVDEGIIAWIAKTERPWRGKHTPEGIAYILGYGVGRIIGVIGFGIAKKGYTPQRQAEILAAAKRVHQQFQVDGRINFLYISRRIGQIKMEKQRKRALNDQQKALLDALAIEFRR